LIHIGTNLKEVVLEMRAELMGLKKGTIVAFVKTVINFQALNTHVIIQWLSD